MSTFPDVRWGSENSKLRRPMIWFASTHAGSWMLRVLTPFDRYVMERSHGRYTAFGPLGVPTMLLTTTGAVSGEPRTTPLLFARDGDDIVVAGSNFGQEHHPAWSKNLIVHPDAIATVGGKEVRVTAELLIGDEALPGFEKMTEVVPVYAEYKNPPERSACSVYALGRRPETLRKSIRCVPRSLPGRGPYMNPAATRSPDSKTL